MLDRHDIGFSNARFLIDFHNIKLETRFDRLTGDYVPTGELLFERCQISKEETAAIMAEKSKIIAVLMDDERENAKRRVDERQAKIAAIEGLREIQEAINDQIRWKEKFDASLEESGGQGDGPIPPHDIPALKETYPRAAAFLLAESWSRSSQWAKSAAGKRALEKIINGDNEYCTIEDMKYEWYSCRDDHGWD